MSSWQTLVDDLVASGKVRGAAIISAADGAVWANTPTLVLKAGEGAALVALYKNPTLVFSSGVTVCGVTYQGNKGDERSIRGARSTAGVGLAHTGQAIVIGCYTAGQIPGEAYNRVEVTADYLIENGY
ncbi:profilin [Streptomyces sp. NBC_00536]|uniref:profilin n=1 Tax=Streptomyces sp. NBC_00536 TaxID=2975769 RepID=UPI002E8179A9|nr:profilin [Streptomyces sp. NBC_00536]WUC77713.1 profilin [Streptomyces sp. NBC_00536]